MPHSKSLSSYTDVRSVLESAKASGGAKYRPFGAYGVPTKGTAIHWRQRALYYRRLLSEHDARMHLGVFGYVPRTSWDDMSILIHPADETALLIKFGEPRGEIEGLDGSEIVPPPPAHEVSDPLLDEAERLAKDLGL